MSFIHSSLLRIREQCLREMGFEDIFHNVKKTENEVALQGLPKLLSDLDALPLSEQVDELIMNILGGNMFDWGSTSVQKMLEKNELDFQTAKAKVGRPAKSDHSKAFKEKLLAKSFKKMVIFVDNSGADIIYGILPFARFLLKQGAKVIIAANTHPAVNDITAAELETLFTHIPDRILDESYKNGNLLIIPNGSGSPCLDLMRVSNALAELSKDADLVVLEGMGRAIHTNYYAKMNVDCLKIAVFKSKQIAEELGFQLYDAICLFEPFEK